MTLQLLRRWYPRRAIVVLAILVLLGLLEGLSLLVLLPLLSLVGIETGAPLGAWGDVAHDVLATAGIEATLTSVLALFVALQLAFAGLHLAHARLALTLQHHIVDRIRRDLRQALDGMEWRAFRRVPPARIAHVLTTEAERTGAATYFSLTMAAGLAVLAVQAALAFRLAPLLSLVVLTTAAAVVFLLGSSVRRASRIGSDLAGHLRGLHERTVAWLHASRLARLQGSHPFPHEQRVLEAQVEAVHARARARFLFDAASVVLLALVTAAAFAVLGLTPGVFLLLLYLYARMMPRANQLHQQWQMQRAALPAWHEVDTLWQTARDHAEGDAATQPPMQQSVALRGATIEEGRFIIQDVDLEIQKGEKVALTGPSGAGKTTLAEAMLGLQALSAGHLVVDGAPLDAPHRLGWRRHCGVVPQDPAFLPGTIRDTLLWGAPDADDASLRAALDDAGCAFLEDLDAAIQGDGHPYSAGERQRIALAMALARRPDLLVLDEPTSHLDAAAEAAFVATLKSLRGPTLLVISHRDAPLAACDRVVHMAAGRIDPSA